MTPDDPDHDGRRASPLSPWAPLHASAHHGALAPLPQVHLAPLAMGTGLAADFAKRIAALTPGFSGAELANVCNEAALIAARRNASTVDSSCFDAAIDRVLAGMEKKGLVHGD